MFPNMLREKTDDAGETKGYSYPPKSQQWKHVSAIICQVLTMPKVHCFHSRLRSLILALNRDSGRCTSRRVRWCHRHSGSFCLPNANQECHALVHTSVLQQNYFQKGAAESAANTIINSCSKKRLKVSENMETAMLQVPTCRRFYNGKHPCHVQSGIIVSRRPRPLAWASASGAGVVTKAGTAFGIWDPSTWPKRNKKLLNMCPYPIDTAETLLLFQRNMISFQPAGAKEYLLRVSHWSARFHEKRAGDTLKQKSQKIPC